MRLRDKYLRWEADVISEVIVRNVYRLPEKFEPDDFIIDVGAHIGVFALACSERGSRKIVCFEPEEENYKLLMENTQFLSWISTLPLALWRSDQPARTLSIPSYSMPWQNPAGASMACVAEDDDQKVCEVAALDRFLDNNQKVRFLKIDAEGAEYPILYTSKRLGQVQEIAVEYHSHKLRKEAGCEANPVELATFLTQQGFMVQWENPQAKQGMLYCKRV